MFIILGIVFNFIIWRSWHRMAWTALLMAGITILVWMGNGFETYYLFMFPEATIYGWVGSLIVKLFRQNRVDHRT